MKVIVELNNRVKCRVTKKFIQFVAEQTLEKVNYSCLSENEITISAAFVSGKEIQFLNKTYRKKDSQTDVLSFSNFESKNEICVHKEKHIFLGELVLCCSYIAQSAQEHGLKFDEEVAYVVSHGILHLLGFDHGSKMYAIQENVSNI